MNKKIILLALLATTAVHAAPKSELRRAPKDPIMALVKEDGCEGAVAMVADAVRFRDRRASFQEYRNFVYDQMIRNNMSKRSYDTQGAVGRFVYFNPALDQRSAEAAIMRQCGLAPASFYVQ